MIRIAIVIACVLGVACTTEQNKRTKSEGVGGIGAIVGDDAQIPGTRDAFLARLIPVEGRGVRVVYEVKGPGGLTGSLEVMARPGAYRRENWALARSTGSEERQELRGATIQTPDRMWSGLDGTPGVRAASPVSALGEAYMSLDEAGRLRVSQSIQRWHADLERARAEHPGDRREVAGVECLDMRIAGQSLCLWEQSGLVLHYEGAEFTATATRVERDIELEASTFALPATAGEAREVRLPANLQIDAKKSIDALADGDYASLSLVLTPGLRLPLPDEGEEW